MQPPAQPRPSRSSCGSTSPVICWARPDGQRPRNLGRRLLRPGPRPSEPVPGRRQHLRHRRLSQPHVHHLRARAAGRGVHRGKREEQEGKRMTASIPAGPPPRLSVPPKFAAPRQLTDAEVGTLRAIADVLIPASGDNPAATSEPAFDQWLARAADARADAFDHITAVLAQLDRAAPDTIDQTWMRDHNARRLELLDAAATTAWEQAAR